MFLIPGCSARISFDFVASWRFQVLPEQSGSRTLDQPGFPPCLSSSSSKQTPPAPEACPSQLACHVGAWGPSVKPVPMTPGRLSKEHVYCMILIRAILHVDHAKLHADPRDQGSWDFQSAERWATLRRRSRRRMIADGHDVFNNNKTNPAQSRSFKYMQAFARKKSTNWYQMNLSNTRRTVVNCISMPSLDVWLDGRLFNIGSSGQRNGLKSHIIFILFCESVQVSFL